MLTIEPASADAAQELQNDLHPDDMAELLAAGVSLSDGLDVECRALRMDGRLVALFGLAGHPTESGYGIPWMLCTNALPLVPRHELASVSLGVVDEWKAQRAVLQNMVHRRNERAIRFVEWLGFMVAREPVGPRGEFYLFTWERASV